MGYVHFLSLLGPFQPNHLVYGAAYFTYVTTHLRLAGALVQAGLKFQLVHNPDRMVHWTPSSLRKTSMAATALLVLLAITGDYLTPTTKVLVIFGVMTNYQPYDR